MVFGFKTIPKNSDGDINLPEFREQSWYKQQVMSFVQTIMFVLIIGLIGYYHWGLWESIGAGGLSGLSIGLLKKLIGA